MDFGELYYNDRVLKSVNSTTKILRLENVSLSYAKQRVLHDVSFTLEKGRILALIGPNGAGKSSMMRVLAGLVRPDGGHATIDEKPVSFNDLRHYFGYFIESPSFYNYLNAKQNLDLLLRMQHSQQTSASLITQVGLDYAGNKKFSQFSKGMKQRLGIAQTLIGEPDFLILDEPFNGLDPEVKENLMALVVKLAHEQGTGVLVTSHLLADLEQMADDFVLLNKGHVHLKGKIADYTNERQEVAFLFLKAIERLEIPETINVISRDEKSLRIKATAAETEQFLLYLAAQKIAPYSVQRSDLLHQKYMEIAQ